MLALHSPKSDKTLMILTAAIISVVGTGDFIWNIRHGNRNFNGGQIRPENCDIADNCSETRTPPPLKKMKVICHTALEISESITYQQPILPLLNLCMQIHVYI